MIKHKIKVFIV